MIKKQEKEKLEQRAKHISESTTVSFEEALNLVDETIDDKLIFQAIKMAPYQYKSPATILNFLLSVQSTCLSKKDGIALFGDIKPE